MIEKILKNPLDKNDKYYIFKIVYNRGTSLRNRSEGLSLVEVLITVSVLGFVAALGVGLVATGIIGGSHKVKLEQDQKTLNTAVAAYLHSGGDLSTASGAEEVILRLKAEVSEERRRKTPGVMGPFLDSAAVLRMQDSHAAERGDTRLVWDAGSKRFLMTSSGLPGIAGLVRDDTAQSPEGSDSIDHRSQTLEYASEGSWIWDYKEVPVPEPLGPSYVPVFETPENSIPPPAPQSPIRPELGRLSPPEFSIPGGTYPIENYLLSVRLSDLNPAGAASIYFRLDYASWQIYNDSPIAVSPNQVLQAQAIPVDSSAYGASAMVEALYKTNPVTLAPPVITLSAPRFSVTSSTVTVEITHDDAPKNSRINYRVDGGAWTDYTGPFVLSRDSYPEGATIGAMAIATSPFYLDSNEANASVGVAPPERPEVFVNYCASGLADHGVTILNGGRYVTTGQNCGVEGNVAIAPGATWLITKGAVTGAFRIHPGTTGDFGSGTNQFGGGGPIVPVISDLSHLREAAIAISAQAASLPATQTFTDITESTTLKATAPEKLNVINIEKISLPRRGGAITITGGPDDFFVLNISKSVKLTQGSVWKVAGGLKASNVIFNLLPGATEFRGEGETDFSAAGIILAPHPGTIVEILGSAAVLANIVTATEFSANGGARVVGVPCK